MLVALTGGIAAGKSTVAATFKGLGAAIVDADQLAREAVAPGSPGLAAVVAEFGETVLHADGSLDRAALGSLVFGDEAARLRLEAIVHPHVQRLSQEQFVQHGAYDSQRVVIYDVPLLAEAQRANEFDAVVVVEAPEEMRVDRLINLRGLTREEALARIHAQSSNAERRALADYVIDTSGSLDETIAAASRVWDLLLAHAELTEK